VTSLLTFHPPDPTYEVKKDDNGEWTFSLTDETTQKKVTAKFSTHVAKTSSSTEIPILCFRTPGATLTMIYSHGNATDIGGMYFIYAAMAAKLKINLVAYDYTGYGFSKSGKARPAEKQTYKDIRRVYDWCIETKLVSDPAKEIVLYGQSVGSGPSCFCATDRPVAGLIIHSGIMSGLRVLTTSRLLCCFDIFPNIDRVKRVKCPVMIIHGKDDREVGFNHGYGLHNAVKPEYQTEPWWVDRRGHNDVLKGNEKEFFKRCEGFLDVVRKRVAEAKDGPGLGSSSSESGKYLRMFTMMLGVIRILSEIYGDSDDYDN
jgi:pimeloyl-ACP methyl ester carboxylesterase